MRRGLRPSAALVPPPSPRRGGGGWRWCAGPRGGGRGRPERGARRGLAGAPSPPGPGSHLVKFGLVAEVGSRGARGGGSEELGL